MSGRRSSAFLLWLGLFLFLLSPLCAQSPGEEYDIGASVEVLWDDTDWYLAEILDLDRGRYFIHYTGYDDAYDEWVEIDRIRPLPEGRALYRPPSEGEFTVGTRVEVRTGGAGYGRTATIVEVGDGRYRLRYDGYDSTEWVSAVNIRDPEAGAVWDALMNRFYYDTTAEGVLGYFSHEGEAPADAYAPERAHFDSSVEILKRESPYGKIDRYGRVSVAGEYLGRIRPQGSELLVWRNGERVGAVSADGVLREAGTVVGRIDGDGELYGSGGESIGGIDPRTGYILGYWGEAEPVSGELHRRLTAAFLFFFTELQHAYRRFE